MRYIEIFYEAIDKIMPKVIKLIKVLLFFILKNPILDFNSEDVLDILWKHREEKQVFIFLINI